jgi:uncharacterized delta-60 repeat protein
LDTSFGDRGAKRINFASVDTARDVIIQRDGKILIAGAANNETDFGVVRLKSDGNLDTSFGDNGKVRTNISGTDGAGAVALQRDGKIVVVGISSNDLAIVRYHGDTRLSAFSASAAESPTTALDVLAIDEAIAAAVKTDTDGLLAVAASSSVKWRYTDYASLQVDSLSEYYVSNIGFDLRGYAKYFASLRGGSQSSVYLASNNVNGWKLKYYVASQKVWKTTSIDMLSVAQWQGKNKFGQSKMTNWGVYYKNYNDPNSWRGAYINKIY